MAPRTVETAMRHVNSISVNSTVRQHFSQFPGTAKRSAHQLAIGSRSLTPCTSGGISGIKPYHHASVSRPQPAARKPTIAAPPTASTLQSRP